MAKLVELGGGPVNPTEREIVQRLVAELPASWRVIPNASLPDPRSGHAYEYDAIVVGPHAVYVVEVKGWRGTIRALSQADWQIGTAKFEKNPLPLADQKARVLATLLRRADYGALGRPPYVQAALVCGDDASTFEVYGLDQRRCLLPGQLVAWLRDPGRLSSPAPPGDYGPYADAITRAIVGRLEARQGPRRFGSYLAESLQSADDESAVWLARHAVFDDGRRYRVRTWFLSSYRYDPAQRERRLAQLRRSAEALHRIGDHPNIATLRDFGEQGGEFYEVTDGSDAGTLETAYVRGTLSRLPPEARLSILTDLADGLAAAFEHGVLHRALDPEHVLLAPDGRARIIDFDRAFLMESAGTVYGALPAPAPLYVPPELRDPRDYEVFDNSDLYSLGRMALRLLGEALPAPVRALLERAAAEEPDQRPADPRAFRAALQAALAPPAAPPPAEPPPAEPAPGDLLDGANRVLAEIARGAGSVVYLVHNETLGEELALKLYTDPAADPAAELRLLRGLASPHAPRAVWSGRLPAAAGQPSRPYLLLERVPGPTLRERLASGPVPPELALAWTDALLSVLDQLHPAAVHRDIKPENVVLSPRGPVLVDFGAAAPVERAGAAPVGTLRYTPPDLYSAGWGPAADLFAVGALLFELLAGVPPWGASAPQADQPPAWDRLPDGLAPALRDALRVALDPVAARRPADAAALRALLAAARLPSPAPPPRAPAPLGARMAEAAAELWSAGRAQRLIRHRDLRVPLFAALEAAMVPPAGQTPDELEAALLASEAALLVLERPLPLALPSAADRLLAWGPPVAADAPEDAPPAEPWPLPAEARLLVLDGLHPLEWALLPSEAERHVWTAGPTDPDDPDEGAAALQRALPGAPAPLPVEPARLGAALDSGARALRLLLPAGARDQEPPGALLARRAALIRAALEAARRRPGPLWVTTTAGSVYLGHGLRQDLAEGLGPAADTARAAWTAAFGPRRLAPAPLPPLRAALPRPAREAAGRAFVVGRLAWPDPPGAPWLHRGGLSLSERLLPLFLL